MRERLRHGSLFSGIGGFDLAAQWMGWENVFQVEWDKRCQRLLKQNFKGVELYGNIDGFSGHRYAGRIDVLSGGPPCQPASNAGKRKGEKDDRWKWPEAIRVFGEIGPLVGVFENPDDLLSLDNGRAFERICVQMEDLGYAIETYGIPAACVGAWHERDRVWIIAYHNSVRGNIRPQKKSVRNEKWYSQDEEQEWGFIKRGTGINTSFASDGAFEGSSLNRRITETGAYWKTEPGVGRMVHGVPDRVDRIKGVGNAIVPQIAYKIFKAIETVIR